MSTSVARTDIDHGTHTAAYAQTGAQVEGPLSKFDAGVASLTVAPDLLSSVEPGNPKRVDFTPKPIPGLEYPDQISDTLVQRLLSALETTTTVFSGSTVAGQNADRILARLLVQLSALLAKGELDERLNKRHFAKIELLESADKTRKAAADEKRATLITSITTIVASCIAIGMSGMYVAASAKTMYSGLGSGKGATQPGATSERDLAGNPRPRMSIDRADDEVPVAVPDDVSSVNPNTGRPARTEVPVEVEQLPSGVQNRGQTQPSDQVTPTVMNPTATNQTAAMSDMSLSQQRTTFGIMGVQTFSQLGPAVGGAAAMDSSEQAKLGEADSRAITAQAEETKGEGDMSAEMRQSLYEMIKTLLEFCKEMNAARVSKMASISKG